MRGFQKNVSLVGNHQMYISLKNKKKLPNVYLGGGLKRNIPTPIDYSNDRYKFSLSLNGTLLT